MTGVQTCALPIWAMGMCCAILPIFGFVVPAGLLLHAAITAEVVPQYGPLFQQAITTIGLGAAAVLVILPAAWICGYALRHGSGWLGQAVRLASVGYAMPGLVVAVGLLAWSGLFTELADQWLNWRVALASTGALLLGAYLTRLDRKSTRLNSSHVSESRMPSSA